MEEYKRKFDQTEAAALSDLKERIYYAYRYMTIANFNELLKFVNSFDHVAGLSD